MNLAEMTHDDIREECLLLLIDGFRGIYAARSLLIYYGDRISGIDDEDREIILAGPDHEDYFDAAEAINNAKITIANGETWSIGWGDGDIFAINQDRIDEWNDATGRSFWDEMP